MATFFAGQQQSKAFIGGQQVNAIFVGGNRIFKHEAVVTNLTNLVPNGGFETNVTGWSSNFGGQPTRIATPTPAHGEAGSYCAQNSGSVNGAHYVQVTPAIGVVNGNRYYVRAQVRYSTNNYGNVVQFMNTAAALAGIGSTTLAVNTWTLADGIWTANAASLTLRINFSGGNGNQQRTAQIDNVMLINLTQAFGASEPSIGDLRAGIAGVGGYWTGTLGVPV